MYFRTFLPVKERSFKGKTVLLTAGPTYEAIDPVRFIGNHSTGKMGFALAGCFAARGAKVYLVSGPTNQKTEDQTITVIQVTSADEMYAAVLEHADTADILVYAAAVADYKPKVAVDKKIKKAGNELTIELVKNVDIAAALGKQKKPGQFSVGFALETDNESANAAEKLKKKNLDMIVLNSLRDEGAGFKHDTNKITIIEKDSVTAFDLKLKTEVAQDIVRFISAKIHA